MKQKNEIMNLAKQNGGYLTSKEVSKNGFSRECLRYLVRRGFLEKSSRGVYVSPQNFDDVFLNAQTNYKKGVFSLGTSLYLLGLSDRVPDSLEMTFPSGYNLTGPKENGIICNSVKKEKHELGICELRSPNGNIVKSYSAERTLCDILVKRNKINNQLITDAFKIYAISDKKNLYELSYFSKLFHVEAKVSSYMEVLL